MRLTHLKNSGWEQIHNFYLERAERLSEREWQSALYVAIDDVLDLIHEGQMQEAEAVLMEIEEHLANVYTGYESTYVVARELSLLGLLAHRWLQEAVEHLFHAVSIVVNASSLEEAEDSLEYAEWGCRLLVVVAELSKHQEDQVKEAA
jgi:hypothetical protein